MVIFPQILENFEKDTGKLQPVLTRYVDSFDGYVRAAQLIEHAGYAAAFLEIADRRKTIISHVSQFIAEEDVTPDKSGSVVGAVHRWWMTVRAAMTHEELRAMLEECVRGETDLSRVIHNALEKGHIKKTHYQLLAAVGSEVDMAIETFKKALEG